MEATTVLGAKDLVKEFRGFRALGGTGNGVHLSVAEGSVHALVGPNGAGKTTLFNVLTGFLPPTRGRIELSGKDITGSPPERIAHLGMARSFQITSLFSELTPRQHVELALQSPTGLGWRFWRSDRTLARFRGRTDELLERVGLAGHAEMPVKSLTYGHKRALEVALALALDPRILLLDEPTAGMGPEDVDRTTELISSVRASRTVVLIEHNMAVVGALADRVTVLQRGEVLAEGSYQEMREDPRVIAAYLGNPDHARRDPDDTQGDPDHTHGDPDHIQGDPHHIQGDPDAAR